VQKILKSFLFTGVQDDLSFIYTARVLFPRVSNRVLIKKSSTVEETFVKTIASAIFMIALWLLLSGIYKPMLVGFGVASVILVLFIVRRMDQVDGDHLTVALNPIKFLTYFIWLLGEIAKSNWAVTKIILSGQAPQRQHFFDIPYSQSTGLGQVIFANSITLTPGTLTVETEQGDFQIHALDYSDEDLEALADMDRRVSAIETGRG
jgi:multicomponent Na+:H+ antiporter subunit E